MFKGVKKAVEFSDGTLEIVFNRGDMNPIELTINNKKRIVKPIVPLPKGYSIQGNNVIYDLEKYPTMKDSISVHSLNGTLFTIDGDQKACEKHCSDEGLFTKEGNGKFIIRVHIKEPVKPEPRYLGKLSITLSQLLNESLVVTIQRNVHSVLQTEEKKIPLYTVENGQLIIPEVGDVSEGIESCDGYFKVFVHMPNGWKIDTKSKVISFSTKTDNAKYTVDVLDGIELTPDSNTFKHVANGWTLDVNVIFVQREDEKKEKLEELTRRMERAKELLKRIQQKKKEIETLKQSKDALLFE